MLWFFGDDNFALIFSVVYTSLAFQPLACGNQPPPSPPPSPFCTHTHTRVHIHQASDHLQPTNQPTNQSTNNPQFCIHEPIEVLLSIAPSRHDLLSFFFFFPTKTLRTTQPNPIYNTILHPTAQHATRYRMHRTYPLSIHPHPVHHPHYVSSLPLFPPSFGSFLPSYLSPHLTKVLCRGDVLAFYFFCFFTFSLLLFFFFFWSCQHWRVVYSIRPISISSIP